MRADLAARLRKTMQGGTIAKTDVTGVAGVADVSRYARKPAELRQLRPLRVETDDMGKGVLAGVISGVAGLPESGRNAIEERAALCAGVIPAPYLDTWARLNHQKPMGVSDDVWYRAVDDGGRFFDTWGALAAEWGWTVGELFDAPREGRQGGLFWFIGGEQVEAFGPDHARLSDGRIFDRGTIGGERGG